MLSRVADSIYWMCRYIERAENVARFIDVNLHLSLDLPSDQLEQWLPLIEVTADTEAFAARYAEANRANVMRFLTFDRAYGNSILSCLCAARENARSVREVISTEMWEQVNKFYLMVKEAETRGMDELDVCNLFYTEVKRAGHLFTGITHSTLTHDDAWHFCRMGQLLERADKTSRILDVKYFYLLPSPADVGTPVDEVQWSAVLRSASALEMYRKRFGMLCPSNIAEFLILDRAFPRAILYCISKAEDSLHAVSGSPPGTFCNAAEQRIGQLRSELAFTRTTDILSVGLHEYLDAFQTKVNQVGQALHATYMGFQYIPGESAS